MRNQTFGIEVELNGILREKAAQVIANHFGTHPGQPGGAPYRTIRIPTGDGRVWKVMRDSSIPGPDAQKCEVVSPVCRWNDLETVKALIRALRAAGAKTDPSNCGIHVHVGAEKHTPQTLRHLVNIVNAKEDLLAQALDIDPNRRNDWCAEVNQTFLENLNRRKPRTMPEFAKLWYGTDNWQSRAASHYDITRYHLLNLHATFSKGEVYEHHCTGTVEFRAFNSTLNEGKIEAYILLCLAINHQALEASAASPKRPITDNPKYTFRCWLLKLGFIGDQFKSAREHLTANLPGNSAWRRAA